MRYLLDTSVCIQVLRGDHAVERRVASIRPQEFGLSAMSVAELRFGVLKGRSSVAQRELLEHFLAVFEVLPFDQVSAEHHATARYLLASSGTPIGERDLVIASTALAHDLVVVTANNREFGRVPGLAVEEWH